MRSVNLIFKCFQSRDKDFLIKLFNVFVRSKLEYCSQVWNPQFIGDIDLIEAVQRKFTRRLCYNPSLSYLNRLNILGLLPLELRRLHLDLIFVYKLVHRKMGVDYTQFFKLKKDVVRVIRGHDYQLFKDRFTSNTTAHFFSNRVVNAWNSLRNNVVSASTVSSFKSRLNSTDLNKFLKGSSLGESGGGPRRL